MDKKSLIDENFSAGGFCRNCKVTIEKDRSYCPVCGKCVNEENLDKPREFSFYAQIEPDKKRFNFDHFIWVLIIGLLVANMVLLVTELVITSGSAGMYLYFLAGSLLLFSTLLWPLLKRYSLMSVIVISATTIPLFLLFLDFYIVHRNPDAPFGWGVATAIPMVLMGLSIVIGISMLFRGYKRRSLLYPSLYLGLLSLALFIVVLCIPSLQPLWPSIVALSVTWGIAIFLFIVRFKKVVKGVKKDFHV